MDLRTILVIALAAIGAIAFVVPYVSPYLSAALASLRQTTPAAPAEVAEPKIDPAKLIVKAGELWLAEGKYELAEGAFALAVKSGKGGA